MLPLILSGLPDGDADLAGWLTEGFGLPPCASSPDGDLHAYEARQVAGAWLLDRPLHRPRAADALQRLQALPIPLQRERMTALVGVLRRDRAASARPTDASSSAASARPTDASSSAASARPTDASSSAASARPTDASSSRARVSAALRVVRWCA